MPAQLVMHPLTRNVAHPAPLLGIIEQVCDATREILLAVGCGIATGFAGRNTCLVQVVGNDRKAEERVLDNLVHRAAV